MKLVPIGPTEGMIDAAFDAPAYGHAETAVPTIPAMYEAMLAAAPTPPAPSRRELEPLAQDQIELPALVKYKSIFVPKEEWRKEPIDHWLREILEYCDYHDGLVIKATLEFLEGLKRPAPPPAEQEDEPVAVIDESDDGKFADLTVEGTFLKRGTKLYTRPDNSKLRKAAEEVLLCVEGNIGVPIDRVRNLRAALEGK